MPMFFISYTIAPEIEINDALNEGAVRHCFANPPIVCAHIQANEQAEAEAQAVSLAGDGKVFFVREVNN